MNTFSIETLESIGVCESQKTRMSLQSLAALCFMSALLLSGSYAQELDAVMNFQVDFVLVDTFADAICTVIGLQSPQRIASIMWQHNGTEIVSEGRISISINLNSGTSNLGITGLAFSDAGEYTCSVVFENPATTRVASDTLQVATLLSVAADPEQEALEGETAILLCTATSFPDPRIRWFRIQGTSATMLGERQTPADENFGMWTIQNVQGSDAGQYRCDGNYNFGSDSVTVELVVLIAPEIISNALINHDVDKGDDLVLDCNATGTRDPVYTWFFNGENLTELENERIQVDEITGILIVQDTEFFDYGNYTCFAANEAGNDTQENIIHIEGSPEIVIPLNDSLTEEIVVGNGTDAELRCNFIAYPTAGTRWFRITGDTETELIGSSNRRYQFGENGTFVIRDVRLGDVGMYRCEVFNVIGTDTRMHRLRVIELPDPPSNLTVVDTGPFSVTLEWFQQPPSALNREVESFVAELSTDGGTTFEQSEQRFPGNETNGTLVDLTPGEMFQIRLRAFNLGGLSEPTNFVEYTSENDVPRLEFFNATAQEGGRSVLLEWELEYDGGEEVDAIRVRIFRDGILVNATDFPIATGRFLITGLDPTTSYTFCASVSNVLGGSEVICSSVVTTVAPPSKPTTPVIISSSTRSLTFTFSVDFGSSPILSFLLNITEHPNGSPDTFNVSVNDTTDFIQSLVDIVDRQRRVVGHRVEMRVSSQLNNQNDYVFAVAAENEIGVGEFSDESNPTRLQDERILYYIIAGVVGGVLLVVVLILLVILIICCKKKISKRRGGKMSISLSYGAPPDTATKTDEFVLQSPPPGKSAVTKNNTYHVQEQSDNPPSPYYNSLSKFQNGGKEYTKQDSQIDVPDSGTKYFKYNPRPVANPSYNDHTPSKLGQPSPKSPYQASLPRSLTNESQGNGHAGNKQYPDSVVSDKHFPPSPIHVSSLRDPLSKSTPVISDRYSDSLPKMATSYQTDV